MDWIENTKGAKKKRKDVDYKFLKEFFQRYFVVHTVYVHERSAVKNSFSKYVFLCYSVFNILNEFLTADRQFIYKKIFLKELL